MKKSSHETSCRACGTKLKVPGFRQLMLNRALRKGKQIIEPKPNELQIDIDGLRAMHRHTTLWHILKDCGLTKGWTSHILPSSQKDHFHIIITMPKNYSIVHRIAMQAILGSDIKREARNFCRAMRGNKYPIVLFKKE
jgi:hypothetical protein